MSTYNLHAIPLTSDAFAQFGNVIETRQNGVPINDHTTLAHYDLAAIDVLDGSGIPQINIFESTPRDFPLQIKMMERHPLSSQAFMPLEKKSFLILVAPYDEIPSKDNLRLFISSGKQGINYHRAVWHHPVIAIHELTKFIVIDRKNNNVGNCDEFRFDETETILINL